MNILLDTNAYSHLFRGDIKVMTVLEKASTVYMSVFVIGELMQGFKGGKKEKSNLNALNKFLNKPSVYELNASKSTAIRYAAIKDELIRKGKPIPINDVWIASHCIETNAQLITYDKHFHHIMDLNLWNQSLR